MLLERPQRAGQLLLATEVPLGVSHARGRQAEVRTLGARGSEHLVGQERGILPEDRLLQLGELHARIQSEFGSEQPPRPADSGERIRLPTLAVLRHAQHDPAPLAQRCLGDAGARQRGDLLNLTRLQPCVQEQLLDAETHLLQTTGRDLSRLPVEEFDEGLAPPQRERLRERVRGAFGFAELQLLRTPRRRVARTARRRPRCSPDQSVAVGGGFDPRRRDEPAQPHDAPPNDMRPRGGRIVAPDRRREGVDRDRDSPRRTVSAAITARSRGASGIRPSSSVSAPRTRTSMSATVTPTPTSVKTADIGPIHARWAPLSC